METRRLLIGAAAVSATTLAFAADLATAGWNLGEPAVSYWGGPGWMSGNAQCPPQNETWVKQLKDGGFNVAWAATPAHLAVGEVEADGRRGR